MLQRSSAADDDTAHETAEAQPSAVVAARLAEALTADGLFFIAADERRAADIAAIAAAFLPDAVVAHLPSSDALPGDEAPASPGNVGQRVAALRAARAAGDAPLLLGASAEATAVRYPEPVAFDTAPPRLATGDPLDAAALTATAEELGYVTDDRVDEPGEIAVRGGVMDVFPADRLTPVRLEIAEGRIAAIHAYDPVSQLTTEPLDVVEIGRATEPQAKQGVSLFAHRPGAAVAFDPDAGERRERFLGLAADGLPRRRAATTLVDAGTWAAEATERQTISLAPGVGAPPRFVERRDPLRAFARFAASVLGEGRLLVTGSARDLRFLAPRLNRAAGIELTAVDSWTAALAAPKGSALMLVAPVDGGVLLDGIAVVAAADLLGGRAAIDATASGTTTLFPAGGELTRGDVVVHESFGLGVIEGVELLPDGGDAIVLRYAKEGRRLVPIGEADRLWRYGADAEAVTLDALDGSTWQKRRGEIDAAIAESARTLSELAREREALSTDPVVAPTADYERFAAGFPFTETPDQARAIAACLHDLASGAPMNRLVVGDVGYGKTEVALRAAAAVALAGRQVAIAAPTTVLARQHIDTFRRRFAGAGITVAGLSRLTGPTERKRVLAGLADGSVGVVVGTGAVAGKGVCYKDLALVVVDEEQRFGAADKAKLAGLGAGPDTPNHVLTLSATPIPRTLQSALVGLQPISVIATPPARRQPIRTAVSTWDDTAVRGALRREHARGGQSFVVVPRIEDMAPLADKLGRLVPELSLIQAHGKLPADELDEAMVGFAHGDGDVLLATNIIEAGLDVPRANTMIVHHADRFGLSQLHQLRGRVGRGGRRGQIMLLTDPDATIAPATLKRLRTLEAFDRLGAGFAISARDLDLRGAGDLVGEAQAGHMKLIGIDLYQHLFGLALRQARGEEVEGWTPELHLELDGRLPEEWIPEEDLRLSLYGRLARISEAAALDVFAVEMEDRFGALPPPAADLLAIARLRVLARAAGVARIDAGPAAIAFTPRPGVAKPDGIDLEERKGRWILRASVAAPRDRVEPIETVLEALAH
jgi:transcription-repair coupling factor (superfamily II helicase)